MLRIGYTKLAVFVTVLAVLACPMLVQAQGYASSDSVQTSGKNSEDLWNDMLAYIKYARLELAASYGQALVDSSVTPEEIFELQRATPGALNDIERAMRSVMFRPVGQQVLALISKGYVAKKSDPRVIAESIDSLMGGTLRGYELASARLVDSGEFAMPQLLQKLMSPQVTEPQKDRIVAFLPNMRLDAVRPLCEALQTDDLVALERIATVLGQIGYPHAAPALKKALERDDLLPRTKQTIEAAFVAVSGRTLADVSRLYYELAEKYYYQAESLAAPATSDVGNVWFWKEGLGLSYVSVPRDAFCNVYAMRCARQALKSDPTNSDAVSLWLASNIRRQANMPEGETDPMLGAEAPNAEFFAMASSAGYLQDVLARGLKDKNAVVITAAISALDKTAGAANLVRPIAGGQQPLVEAMQYPDGRVRFHAAVTLAQATPTQRFGGWEGVIPVLTDAIQMTVRNRALILGDDETLVNQVKSYVRSAGWQVIEGDVSMANQADAVVLARKASPTDTVSAARRAGCEAIIILAEETTEVQRLAEREGVTLLATASSEELVHSALEDALAMSSTPGLSDDEAGDWAIKAANAIRTLAMTNNTVFDLEPTIAALSDRLGDKREDVRLAAAAALGAIGKDKAQQALTQLGLDDNAPVSVRVAALNYASESARRFSNMLTESNQQAVLDLVMNSGDMDVRQAGARLLGILNLPSEKIKDLILQTGTFE